MARQKYAVALIKASMSAENNSYEYICGMLAMALELKKITQAEYWQLKKELDGREEALEEVRIYGYEVEVWNSFTEEEQIAIQDREEYNSLHRGQGDWW